MRRASLLFMLALAAAGTANAGRVSDVRNTRHNLSADGPGTTHAAPGGTTEVCVFCHTPHGASQQDAAGNAVRAPLWNRPTPSISPPAPTVCVPPPKFNVVLVRVSKCPLWFPP